MSKEEVKKLKRIVLIKVNTSKHIKIKWLARSILQHKIKLMDVKDVDHKRRHTWLNKNCLEKPTVLNGSNKKTLKNALKL